MKKSKVTSSSVSTTKSQTFGETDLSPVDKLASGVVKYFSPKKCVIFSLVLISIGFSQLVVSSFLLGSYNLHLLTVASSHFLITPVLLVISSALHVGLSIILVVWILRKPSAIIKVSSIILVIMIIFHLVVTSLSVYLLVTMDNSVAKINMGEQLEAAVSDEAVMAAWADLQTRHQCCGGRGHAGHEDWPRLTGGSYPDSCCTVHYKATKYSNSVLILHHVLLRLILNYKRLCPSVSVSLVLSCLLIETFLTQRSITD